MFCHSAWLQISPARFKKVYSDSALWSDSALALDPRSTGLGKMVQEPRAGFYVAEWRMFCHSAWLQISPARLQQVYSDSARARFYV